jgi:hypothetical protein
MEAGQQCRTIGSERGKRVASPLRTATCLLADFAVYGLYTTVAQP